MESGRGQRPEQGVCADLLGGFCLSLPLPAPLPPELDPEATGVSCVRRPFQRGDLFANILRFLFFDVILEHGFGQFFHPRLRHS